MKGTHLYERLSNPQAVKTYINMIKTNDIEIVKVLVGNITMEANDHPRYPTIYAAYEDRLNVENNKE